MVGLHPIVVRHPAIWDLLALFEHAGGAASGRRSPCIAFLLGVKVSSESLVWFLTTSDDGAIGIYFHLEAITVRTYFHLEAITVRTSTYTRTNPGENQETDALVRVVAIS